MRGVNFTWYELRTTDVEAAQHFYTEVLGWSVRPSATSLFLDAEGEPAAELSVLSERARALGAPPNWLGHLAVTELGPTLQRFLAAGAEPLGPVRRDARGEVATLRSPHGEVLGLSTRREGPSRAVRWHELNTTDAERALRTYAELAGFRATGRLALAPALDPYLTFAFADSRENNGGMVGTARAPHIHTHWLYYFAVRELDAALAKVRGLGGAVLAGPFTLPGGERVAPCEDAQGAAFALRGR